MKFTAGDRVIHKKTGHKYIVVLGYYDNVKLEKDGIKVYVYTSLTPPPEYWVRPAKEFEDGRFELIKE